jgi:hypothetical protein
VTDQVNLTGQILADVVSVTIILGLVWRASSILARIRFEVTSLREDVDKLAASRQRVSDVHERRMTRIEKRVWSLERWRASRR